ncbi:MAG TPA: cytoplasmic protein [Porphyromonadaceae bacterium]|nr:cytoplasmic protein [Porphyromonadaceae bacterium]
MNIEELRAYCLSVRGATESTPFLDDSILVFKVMGKMFAYAGINPKDGIFKVDLKCDPDYSAELREKYNGITHGTHTRGLLWNAVFIDSDVPDELIRKLIDHSVGEVIRKLSGKLRQKYHDEE